MSVFAGGWKGGHLPDQFGAVFQHGLELLGQQPGLGRILDVAAFVSPDAITLELLGGTKTGSATSVT